MKKLLIYSAAIAAIFAGHSANSQKVMKDPGYSPHNYKHPNKAAYAKKQQENQPVIYLEEVKDENEKETNSLTASANYKGMSAGKSKIRKFRVVNAPVTNPAFVPAGNRNYKQQFAPKTKSKNSNEIRQNEEMPVVKSN